MRAWHPGWLVLASVLTVNALFGIGAYRYAHELPIVPAGLGTGVSDTDVPTVYISNLGDGNWGKYAWGIILNLYTILVARASVPVLFARTSNGYIRGFFSVVGILSIISITVWTSYPASVNNDMHKNANTLVRVFVLWFMMADVSYRTTRWKLLIMFIAVVYGTVNNFTGTSFLQCAATDNVNTSWICSYIQLIGHVAAIFYPCTLYDEILTLYTSECAHPPPPATTFKAWLCGAGWVPTWDLPWPLSRWQHAPAKHADPEDMRPLVLVHPHTHTGHE